MTNEERDTKIEQTHDAIIRAMPMIENHEKTLYGNGQVGLKDRVITLETTHRTGRGNAQFAISVMLAIIALVSVILSYIRTPQQLFILLYHPNPLRCRGLGWLALHQGNHFHHIVYTFGRWIRHFVQYWGNFKIVFDFPVPVGYSLRVAS